MKISKELCLASTFTMLMTGLCAQEPLTGTTVEDRPDGVRPARIIERTATVSASNSWINPSDGILMVEFLPPTPQRGVDTIRDTEGIDGIATVNRLVRSGMGAGLSEVLYDNRDSGHSTLMAQRWLTINFTRYDKQFQARRLHHGAGGNVMFSLPTLGNSSTAQTRGPYARSQGRIALVNQAAAERAFKLYTNNHLYFYPEHKDHDPERGDLFFANVPFFLLSQGSSGSDQPLLKSVAMAIAALRPDTYNRLRQTGLISPTMQMIFRRAQRGVSSDADYLSGRAHPSAFPPDVIDVPKMIQLAQSLAPGQIPPVVFLKIEKDFRATPKIDYLAPDLGENLFTTPVAISRAWRSTQYAREVVISAEGTQDPNQRDLRFEWVVLRGDTGRIKISHAPDDLKRERARIEIEWHDAYQVPGNETLTTRRIDIGVFARNGASISAPSFFSVVFPTHQSRRYEAASDGRQRIVEIDYAWKQRRTIDPALWPTAPWIDAYTYDENSRNILITRTYANGSNRSLKRGVSGLVEVSPDDEIAHVVHTRNLDADNRPVLDDGYASN